MSNTSASSEPVLTDLISLWQRRRAEGQAVTPAELCRECPELLPELEQRITALERMANLVDAAHETVTFDTARSQPELPASAGWPSIPGYEILGELGRGGMGVVYKARQVSLNRIVALKMILAGAHAGQEATTRFLREAEIIARMKHPHVVQVHEFGSHEGKAFFSLEYLEGGSLADKLRGEPQSPAQAAQMVEVLACAVEAAHTQGVVHRDLKPGNVLLTSDGAPKITDFGLAKQGESGTTATGQVMGTPSYMAPEQAGGKSKEIGPTVDIYALGAILYELLTGRPPFKGASAWDTLQMVVGMEPVPPRQLQPKVPRDLETICLKCLHKDAGRRYRSALALAEDMHRFLNDEPIHARPIRAPERMLRWARRSPRVATLSAAVVLLVILLLAGSFLATARIAHSRDNERSLRESADDSAQNYRQLAEKERLTADSAKNAASLLANLFESSDPIRILGGTRSSRRSAEERRSLCEMLDSAHRDIRSKFTREPALLALLLDAIGNAYRSLGEYERAEPLLREGLVLRRERADKAPLDLAESLHHLAWWHHEKGDYEVAEKMYQEALDLRIKALQTEEQLLVAASKFALAWLLTESEESEKPERLFREVIATRRRLLGPDHREVAIAEVGLAAFFLGRQRRAEAAPLLGSAAKNLFSHGELGKIGEAVIQFQIGVSSREAGWFAAAELALRRSLTLTRQVLGDKHIYVALVLHELGDTQEKRGHLREAAKTYQECLDIASKQVGLTHPKAVYPIASLARVLAKQGRRSEAEQLFAQLRQANEKRHGRQNVRVAVALSAYAHFLDYQAERSRSAQVHQEADHLFRKVQATSHRIFALNLSSWASTCWALKRYKQAEKLAREALPLLEHHCGRDSQTVVELLDTLALSLIDQKRFTQAEPLCQQTLQLSQRYPSARWTVLDTAGRLYQGKGELAEAEKYYREALALARKEQTEKPGDMVYSLKNLAKVLMQRGEHQQAAPLLTEAERLRKQYK